VHQLARPFPFISPDGLARRAVEPVETVQLQPPEDRLAWSVASKEELGRKLRILNAYYLPGQPPMQPYPTITPVNTFRLILDDYFGANLELLPDRTYVFADFEHPYRFEDVTDRLRDT
jgi:hypothetical protein